MANINPKILSPIIDSLQPNTGGHHGTPCPGYKGHSAHGRLAKMTTPSAITAVRPMPATVVQSAATSTSVQAPAVIIPGTMSERYTADTPIRAVTTRYGLRYIYEYNCTVRAPIPVNCDQFVSPTDLIEGMRKGRQFSPDQIIPITDDTVPISTIAMLPTSSGFYQAIPAMRMVVHASREDFAGELNVQVRITGQTAGPFDRQNFGGSAFDGPFTIMNVTEDCASINKAGFVLLPYHKTLDTATPQYRPMFMGRGVAIPAGGIGDLPVTVVSSNVPALHSVTVTCYGFSDSPILNRIAAELGLQ